MTHDKTEGYRFAALCNNGHCSSDFLTNTNYDQRFCQKCGAEIITSCPVCGVPIRGKYYSPGFIDLTSYSVPSYCYSCGKPFPWTRTALEVATILIEEEAGFSQTDQERLVEILPDIITETPKSNLAAIRFKKALMSAGKFTAEALRQFAIDFGCEFFKKQLGL